MEGLPRRCRFVAATKSAQVISTILKQKYKTNKIVVLGMFPLKIHNKLYFWFQSDPFHLKNLSSYLPNLPIICISYTKYNE